jgi:hypothetical protein
MTSPPFRTRVGVAFVDRAPGSPPQEDPQRCSASMFTRAIPVRDGAVIRIKNGVQATVAQ